MTSVFLHGYGSSPARFREAFSRAGVAIAPDALFLDGLEHDPMSGHRRWFPLTRSEGRLATAVDGCAARVETCLRLLLRFEHGVTQPLHLFGHSQGGMLALELACRALLPIESVRCFAAFLPTDCRHAPGQVHRNAALTLLSSNADRYVPRQRVRQTVARLRALGFARVDDRVSSVLPHDFSPHWLQDAAFEAAE